MTWLKQETALIKRIFKDHKIECVILLLITFISLTCFRYFDAELNTAFTVQIWDAVFSGNPLNFRQVFADNLRNSPRAGTYFDGGHFLVYMPWSIWNLPLWLTHSLAETNVLTRPCLIWSQLFLIIYAFYTGLQCCHIVEYFTKDKRKANIAAILLWGSGTLWITIGYSMQDEVLYVAAFLASMRCYFEEKYVKGFLFLIISTTLCPFMVLPTALLLLYREKNILKLGGSLILLLVPYVLANILFPARIPLEDNFADYFLGRTTLYVGYGSFSVYTVVVFFIYIMTYLKRFQDNSLKNRATVHSLAVLMTAMSVLSWLHFYRYFICFPFLIISLLISDQCDDRKTKACVLLLIAFEFFRMIGMALFDINCLNPNYASEIIKDQIGYNILPSLFSILEAIFSGTKLSVDFVRMIVLSIIIAIAIGLFWLQKSSEKALCELRVRMKTLTCVYTLVPLMVFFGYLLLTLHAWAFTANIGSNSALTPGISNDTALVERLYSDVGQHIKKVSIRPVTWKRDYPDDLKLTLNIVDVQTNEVVGKAEILADQLPNNDICALTIEGGRLSKNKWYDFIFTATGTIENDEQMIYLLRSDDGSADTGHHYSIKRNMLNHEDEEFTFDIVSSMFGLY